MPLVSVRSGAKFSMPGMMDTILNVGITADNGAEWAKRLGVACLTNSLHRLNAMYADVVGGNTPGTVEEQLFGAIIAVFKSWGNDRAVTYRNMNSIPHDLGTAVIVQAMVFGNMNEKSATGVCFSRNFSTGANEIVGEWLVNAQGEDVVDGSHDPLPMSKLAEWNSEIADELAATVTKLETMNGDMQDVEFTVMDGKLFILQTRNGKRTAAAAVKIALDLHEEGMPRAVALRKVTQKQVLMASRPALDKVWFEANPAHAKGLAASNGVAVGKAVFTAAAAIAATEPVVLIREETDPDDIGGIAAAVGVLTKRGGMTSHAAVVSRSMDKVVVVGCGNLHLDGAGAYLKGDDGALRPIVEGKTTVAIDGASGSVWVEVEPAMVGGATGDMKNFLALVAEEYGYYEVALDAAKIVNPESKVVIPAYAMGVAELEKQVAAMATMVGELIVDLRSPVVDPISAPLTFLWGVPEDVMIDKVMALVGLASSAVAACAIKVVTVNRLHAKKLGEAGYDVVPVIKSWADLETTGGLVIADHAALKKVPKPAGIEINAHSLNCVSVLRKDVPTRGAKFALTPINAALSLLG